jgi:hypothetical protein
VRALESEGRGLPHLEVVARGGRLRRQLASRGIDRGKETVQGVWIEEYYKPMQEALKKAAQAAQAEPPKNANAEGNGFIKYATGASIELEDTDTTFIPIEWRIGKVSTFPTLYRYALDTLSSFSLFLVLDSCYHYRQNI